MPLNGPWISLPNRTANGSLTGERMSGGHTSSHPVHTHSACSSLNSPLTDGAKLFVYDSFRHGTLKGAFTEENNKEFGQFYVGHVPGEEVVIELQTNDPGRDYGSLRIG